MKELIRPTCVNVIIRIFMIRGKKLKSFRVNIAWGCEKTRSRILQSQVFLHCWKVCYSCLVVSKEASLAQKADLVRKCLEKIRGALTVPKKNSRRLIFQKFVQTSFFLTACWVNSARVSSWAFFRKRWSRRTTRYQALTLSGHLQFTGTKLIGHL